jgi:hypothetical protein
MERAKRLDELGFKETPEACRLRDIIWKQKQAKSKADIIQYYKQTYPQYKFITESEVSRICKKYNLVHGSIDRYKGNVPDKNIKEIEDFKILDKDLYKQSKQFFGDFGAGNIELLLEESEPLEISSYKNYISANRSNYYYKNLNKSDLLSICAPVEDMIINSNEKIENNKIISIPDPVVLHVVPNGYLIVSKWGLPEEANKDIDLINETMN